MAIGNQALCRGRRPSTTPNGAALPAGLRSPKPKTLCLGDLSAGRAGGHLLVQERNSANTPTVTYTRGRDLSGSPAGAGGIGGLLARSHGYSGGNWSSHNAYHADGNGNVTALANSVGALQASYRYDPYGRYLAGGGPLASANLLRFSSKPWVGFAGSATSGLYYYGYRFYDPYLQRWVKRDPIGEKGGFSLYSYVRNSPLTSFDPDGRLPRWLKWVGGGAGLAAGIMSCIWHSQTACDRWRDTKLEEGRREANLIAAGDSQHHEEGSRADALAHCIAACKLAREPGPCDTPLRAQDSLQSRETRERVQSRMDMWNNQIGADIASKEQESCARACIRLLNGGYLATFEGSEVVPFPPGKYFPPEEW